ncbi:MAG: hypothetical protein UW19_C0025G0006 [Candidatus Moranbacteria bacterium GW2011_GWF2_44_10]|nr:MAG: hypothetical protein UW19_C0025G0006 [Candidatus Moranbacteria bacterium GW2011_GWF2_44_10]
MCCGGSMYPNRLGVRISQLKVGEQIIVLAGEGYPSFERDRVDIVCSVDGYSALTAQHAIAINCNNISAVIPTGNHFDDFLISPEAKEILKAIKSDSDQESFDSEPE